MSQSENLERLIAIALDEDWDERGDVTTDALVSEKESISARVVAREDLVLAVGEVPETLFGKVGGQVEVIHPVSDGKKVQAGTEVLELKGPVRPILAVERTLLNFIQRMCGIATLTRRYVDAVDGFNVDILDTRKTAPGMRGLAKYSVSCGGGRNHRMGLYDKAMIKDNHRIFWRRYGEGGLKEAAERIRRVYPDLEVEMEVDDEDEMKEALQADPDWILLDNMEPTELRKCVEMNRGIARLEASGGVTLNSIRKIADTGVDAISVGALTHSAVAADLALDFKV